MQYNNHKLRPFGYWFVCVWHADWIKEHFAGSTLLDNIMGFDSGIPRRPHAPINTPVHSNAINSSTSLPHEPYVWFETSVGLCVNYVEGALSYGCYHSRTLSYIILLVYGRCSEKKPLDVASASIPVSSLNLINNVVGAGLFSMPWVRYVLLL